MRKRRKKKTLCRRRPFSSGPEGDVKGGRIAISRPARPTGGGGGAEKQKKQGKHNAGPSRTSIHSRTRWRTRRACWNAGNFLFDRGATADPEPIPTLLITPLPSPKRYRIQAAESFARPRGATLRPGSSRRPRPLRPAQDFLRLMGPARPGRRMPPKGQMEGASLLVGW